MDDTLRAPSREPAPAAPEPAVEPWVTPGDVEVDTGSPQDDGPPDDDVVREPAHPVADEPPRHGGNPEPAGPGTR